MSKTINNGGPAFPCNNIRTPDGGLIISDGMTIRDYFAAKAMQGILANQTYFATLQDQAAELCRLRHTTDAFKLVSELSRDMADAMLRARGEA